MSTGKARGGRGRDGAQGKGSRAKGDEERLRQKSLSELGRVSKPMSKHLNAREADVASVVESHEVAKG